MKGNVHFPSKAALDPAVPGPLRKRISDSHLAVGNGCFRFREFWSFGDSKTPKLPEAKATNLPTFNHSGRYRAELWNRRGMRSRTGAFIDNAAGEWLRFRKMFRLPPKIARLAQGMRAAMIALTAATATTCAAQSS